VVVAIGHSNATYLEAKKSFDLGINVATHLFNAMSQMEARTPGVVPAVLNDENVYAGIIVDGLHVDYNVIKLAKKIKGEKLFVVTDTATAMGTDMEEFVFGDQRVLVKDGKFVSENGVLAGANISMILSLKNLVKHVNIPLTEALRMLSLYPARVMKIDNQLGKIQVGFKANFVLFDMNYKVNYMIENGQIFDFTDEEIENKTDENSENK
jgi:N-acetylglucosamine-6-phosphate deacetylase